VAVQKHTGNRWRRWGAPLVLWVGLVCLFGGLLSRRQHQIQGLQQRRSSLEQRQTAALQQRESLKSRLQLQDDPAAIELALMRRLGLVPEGWTKVYFAPMGDRLSQ
jgi:hypothetical protein